MNKNILLTGLLLLSATAVAPVFAADQAKAPVDYLSKINAAIAASPKSYVLYHNRAAYYMTLHQDAAAIADENKAVALSSNDPEMVSARSKIYLQMNNYPKALADLNLAIQAKPGDSAQRFTRATVLLKLKQYNLALADLNILVKANPRTGYLYGARGQALMGQQKYAKALADYNAALLCNFQNPEMLSDMYKEYIRERKFEQALQPLDKLIASTPETPAKVVLYRQRLDLYSKIDHSDPNLVANDLLKIGDLEPANVAVHFQFANSQWQRQPLLALQALNQIIKVEPTNADAFSLLARIQVDHDMTEEAILNSNKAIELAPRAAINFSTRAQARLKNKKYAEAISDATAAITLQPDLAEPYYFEGAAQQALQQNREALGAFNQYLAMKAKDAVHSDDDTARIEEAKRRVKFVEGSLATVERQNSVRTQSEAVPAH